MKKYTQGLNVKTYAAIKINYFKMRPLRDGPLLAQQLIKGDF